MRLILGLFGVMIGASVASADHYDVFLVAGQSNTDGRGAVSQLTGDLSKWKQPQPDVLIAYSCSKLRGPILESGGFQPLQPGWSVAPGAKKPKSLPSDTFGPELAFGRTLADKLTGQKIALIKYAEGGTSLSKDWNPDTKDRLYTAFLEFTKKNIQALKDKGHTVTIRGMIWHQGESDAALTAEDYEKRLTDFIARVRIDLDSPNLPFGIGEVIDNKKRDSILAAQRKVAQTLMGTFLVPAEGLTSHDGGTHFDAKSQIELGTRFANGMLKALPQK